jgi:hypothetical protein
VPLQDLPKTVRHRVQHRHRGATAGGVDTGFAKDHTRTGDSGQQVVNRFCPDCGSTIVIEPAALPGTTIIPAGTLDDTSWLKPTMEIYCDDAQSWVELGGGGMQRFPKMHHAQR